MGASKANTIVSYNHVTNNSVPNDFKLVLSYLNHRVRLKPSDLWTIMSWQFTFASIQAVLILQSILTLSIFQIYLKNYEFLIIIKIFLKTLKEICTRIVQSENNITMIPFLKRRYVNRNKTHIVISMLCWCLLLLLLYRNIFQHNTTIAGCFDELE